MRRFNIAAAFIALLALSGAACHQAPAPQTIGTHATHGGPKGSLIVPLSRSTWIPIGEQTVTGTTYTSPTWAAGTYRFLKFYARCTASGGNATVTLTGLTGTYDSGIFFSIGAGALSGTANPAWLAGFGAGFNFNGEIDIRNGAIRSFQGMYVQTSSTTRGLVTGGNDDTTHDVTGFVMTLGSSGTFTVTLMGMP